MSEDMAFHPERPRVPCVCIFTKCKRTAGKGARDKYKTLKLTVYYFPRAGVQYKQEKEKGGEGLKGKPGSSKSHAIQYKGG
ncbi:MAG: hypothetical protein A2Y05_00450 [Omnitrophica WOR_2 bacterium GWA2_53_43]|nr:MAG: hypothetical protein A2Y05_00450 [Omnitrophica WOR_2 bacterium GWA2_53_43]